MPCSLWDIAIEERRAAEKNTENNNTDSGIQKESHLFVCGSKDAGKTSLIQRLLERDEAPKPTVALDFIFGRKSKGNNLIKDVTHLWELGGGTSMAKLINTTITTENIKRLSVVVALDLSQPNKLWETQHILLSQIKSRIEEVVGQASSSNPKIHAELKSRAVERIGESHADLNRMEPSLVPILIVGTKLDLFQELDVDQKAMICKTLRYLAHSNGAMLHFWGLKSEGLSTRVKSVFSHLAFGTALSKTSALDNSKPLIVPFGGDSFELIGPPPLSNEQLMRLSKGGSPYQLWMAAFASLFQPQKQETTEKLNPATDPQFSEESVDIIREQKNQELDRYRKLCERKAKEAQINVGIPVKAKKR